MKFSATSRVPLKEKSPVAQQIPLPEASYEDDNETISTSLFAENELLEMFKMIVHYKLDVNRKKLMQLPTDIERREYILSILSKNLMEN